MGELIAMSFSFYNLKFVEIKDSTMNFEEGDKITFINDDLDGEVLSVSHDVVIIRDEDGFERSVSPNEIIKKKEFLIDSKPIAPKAVDIPRRKKSPPAKVDATPVVDLHFHEIYPTDEGLTNFQKLNMQLDYALNQIERAKQNKIRSIVFIHGKGAGVLRSELRALVKKLDNCFYEDADWRKYGQGATRVVIG